MSPVHRSSSNVDAASNAAIAASVLAQERFSEGEEDLEDAWIQRSASMPPAMFDGESSRSSRDRGRSGICIQRNRGSRHRHRIIQESRSEDELTTSGGGKEGGSQESEEAKVEEVATDSYPRGRRNAFRGARVVRRATCAADGSYSTGRSSAAERPEYVGHVMSCDANSGSCDPNSGSCDANSGSCDANVTPTVQYIVGIVMPLYSLVRHVMCHCSATTTTCLS